MYLFIESILALGLLPLAAFGFFVLAMIISVTFDRRETTAPKWWVFSIGFVALLVYGWLRLDWKFSDVFSFAKSGPILIAIGQYFLAGLVYSLVEFALEVRRSARRYREEWVSATSGSTKHSSKDTSGDNNMTIAEKIADVAVNGAVSRNFNDVHRFAHDFVVQRRSFNGQGSIIKLDIGDDKVTPVPFVDKGNLAASVGAWTFFWPFYAISLIVGDLFTEIFRIASNIIVKLSGRFVRMSFANVFKV